MVTVPIDEPRRNGSPGAPAGAGTPREEEAALALYETLRARGGIPGAELAAALDAGAGDSAVRRAWRRLEDLGLVQVSDGVAEALDPDAALARAMDRYQANATAQLRNGIRLQRVTEALAGVYRPAVQREATEVAVEFIRERPRKERNRLDMSETARELISSMHPGPMPPMEVLEASHRHDVEIMARGVRVRAIYPMACLHTPRYARYLHELADSGADLRLVDHAPFDMLTFDRHAAVLTADPENPSDAIIVIRGTALLRSFLALYEDCWLRGLTLAGATAASTGDADITAQERAVIRLLASGLTDDQIARKLGVHRRTVQRAVAKLMERLNAASRFEAGLKLAGDEALAALIAVR
jgi:DNA-binding CsgD family transcriptional regulator